MIFRLVCKLCSLWVSEKLVRGTDKSLTITSGVLIAEGAIAVVVVIDLWVDGVLWAT